MKIAIPYENGQVFQHFGHSAQFKLYTAEEGRITALPVPRWSPPTDRVMAHWWAFWCATA